MSVAQGVKKMRDFYANDLPTRIAFHTHPLREANDYIKDVYCTMLAVVLQYENEPLREQIIFLERITAGVGLETSVQQLMQKAQLVDEKFANDFYDELIDSSYVENFVVDALVMTNCTMKVNDKQLGLLTELVDVLGVTEAQLKQLVQLVKGFLGMDQASYRQLVVKQAKVSYLNKFAYYIASLVGQAQKEAKFESESVLIYWDAQITSEMLGQNLKDKSLVIFKQCKFSRLQNTIHLEHVDNVIFDECLIENCNTRVFSCSSVQNICVYKTTVSNVHYRGADSIHGAFLKMNSASNLYMYASKFENITVYASNSNPYSSGPIALGPIGELDIRGNQFIGCKANGRYWTRNGGIVVNEKSFEKPLYNVINIEGKPTFGEYLQNEYKIEAKNQLADNQLKDCQPNQLYLVYE